MTEPTIAEVLASHSGRSVARVPVTRFSSGNESKITVQVVGSGREPRVLVVVGTHGGETFVTELMRVFLATVDDERFEGSLLVLANANVSAFEANSRHTPNDMMNLNRLFPGNADGWYTEMLADAIVRELLPHANWVFDYHCPSDKARANLFTYTRSPDSEYGRKVHELAVASGAPILCEAPQVPGSLSDYCESVGLPAIVFEVGGSPSVDDVIIADCLKELESALQHVGVLSGTPSTSGEQIFVKDSKMLRSRHGGLFSPEIGFETLGKTFQGQKVLGRIYDPNTFELLEELYAPYESNLLMSARAVSKVEPGEWMQYVGNMATAVAAA